MKLKRGYQITLLVGTLAIWVALIYRVVAPKNEENAAVFAENPFNYQEDIKPSLEAFVLPVQINDPFVKVKARQRVVRNSVSSSAKTPVGFTRKKIKTPDPAEGLTTKKPIDLIYQGYMKRNSDGNEQALVNYQGKDRILEEGKEIGGMTLQILTKDSLVFVERLEGKESEIVIRR